MKLVVAGFGQCGGRIADEFAKLNKKARRARGIEITTDCYAINADAADLSGLRYIGKDYQHRIIIGSRKTGGHGVGKINELGAEIARDDSDKVIDAIRQTKRFFETDAFLFIASAGGGTGSGSIAVMTQKIKERFAYKPIFNLIVLPFEHEETTEDRTIYNTATCLKSSYSVADAVFLVDNQRFVRKDTSIKGNIDKINEMIAAPFYNMLCAGEEKKAKYVASKVLDAGDIIQTLTGWTTIGYGKSNLPLIRFGREGGRNFREKGQETLKGIQAMDEAISELSLKCNPVDSKRALYLISAPSKEMNMDLVKALGDYMRDLAPEALIRNGDYPRERGQLDVTVILSELSDVEKVRKYYSRSTSLMSEFQKRQDESEAKLKELIDASETLPSLF
ncbi:MAG: cell division protein FtsZ [Dehalococcoidia bacterium SG8_51_3]|nr:MAG: cell division protein FtsZ [Dehalococcoidia bacterium SG8_51_3]